MQFFVTDTPNSYNASMTIMSYKEIAQLYFSISVMYVSWPFANMGSLFCRLFLCLSLM